jgi:hypothetical protein
MRIERVTLDISHLLNVRGTGVDGFAGG